MDKLTVIQNALIATGNNRINALNDGSDEWDVANTGFTRALTFLIARHNWPFAMTIEPMTRVADADNKSRSYPSNGFQVPAHFHLIEILHLNEVITDYEFMGTIVSCPYDSDMFAKIVRLPPDANWHPMATEILTLMVESACYRGLNEDTKEALGRWSEAENLLLETRTRVDQENPARNAFKSSIREARGRRRR